MSLLFHTNNTKPTSQVQNDKHAIMTKKLAPSRPKPTIQLSPQQQEQFDQEIAWCVHQLELGLQRPNVDAEQAKESRSVIAKLKSPKLNVVQKRHLMANVFGDWRKFMRQEQKQKKEQEAAAAASSVNDSDTGASNNKEAEEEAAPSHTAESTTQQQETKTTSE